MSTATVTAPDAVFEIMRESAGPLVHRAGVKYSMDVNSPYTSPEDFEQEVWTRLWEWLGDPFHVEQIMPVLEDDGETKRWMNQFCRARCCDLIDVALAGNRDQRHTVTASRPVDDGDIKSTTSLLEHLAFSHGRTAHCDLNRVHVIETLRDRIYPDSDALTLLNVILDPPASLRESFVESRLRPVRGIATLTEADGPHTPSVLKLVMLEGYDIGDQEVTWDGPIPFTGTLDTDQGECKISRPERGVVVLRWTETSIVVRLDTRTHEGEFLREVIRPSPRVFDYQAMRDHLGISGLRIRQAWLRLAGALKDELGAA